LEAEIPTRYHIVRNLTLRERASIIIPGRTGKSLEQSTDYENFEIVQDSSRATGLYLVFLHADVRPQKPDWLANLLAIAQQPEVGVVGAKLVYPNGAIQHSGMVTGMSGDAGYPGRGLYQSDYWRWLDYTRNVTAVSGACLVTRRQVFESVGGFDEAFHSDLAAVDFCLRVRQAGFDVVVEPRACLIHQERDRIQPSAQEQGLFRKRWHEVLARPDPYYSRFLRLDREDTSLRWPTESASDGSPPAA
jgi:GT2 family glycosyltransferase